MFIKMVNELMSLCYVREEKLNRKDEAGEQLVGAVLNRILKC